MAHRLGHVSDKCLTKLRKNGFLGSFDFESYDTWKSCLIGKMIKGTFTGHSERATNLLGFIHTDVCRPLNISTSRGYLYFITFIDNFSRYG